MSLKISTGLRNHVLASGSIKTAFDGVSELRFYAGTEPATADAAIGSATLLTTIKKDGTTGLSFAASPVAGVLSKNSSEVWKGTNVAAGTPVFYRHVLITDDGTASSTALRYQGSVSTAGADINLTAATLASGEEQQLNAYNFTWPAA